MPAERATSSPVSPHHSAETEFAGEEEKELSAGRVGMALTLADAVLAWLAENVLVRDRPGDAGDRQRQSKQPHELQRESHP